VVTRRHLRRRRAQAVGLGLGGAARLLRRRQTRARLVECRPRALALLRQRLGALLDPPRVVLREVELLLHR